MKVVVPFAGLVHPETRAAVDRWPDHQYVDVSGNDYAYGRLLKDLWATGEGFCIVEHDVAPWLHTIPEMALCPSPYCAAPYPWGQATGVALGLTKFSGLFCRHFPDAMEIACRIPSNYGDPGHWRQLDVWLMAAVLRDLYGWQPHTHLPAVRHRNPRFDVDPDSLPLRTRVEGRCYLPDGLVEGIARERCRARTS